MTETKTTKKEQAGIDGAMESLCDDMEQISLIQAQVIRALYRDKATHADVARKMRIPLSRVYNEQAAANLTMVKLLTGGAIDKWSTPGEGLAPDMGQSLAVFEASLSDVEGAGTTPAQGAAGGKG